MTSKAGGCGLKCSEFASYSVLDGCWLKTSLGYCQQVMFEDHCSEEFCETWPQSGIVSNGIAYRLEARKVSAGHTDDEEFGLLPTPASREDRDWSRGRILASLDRGNGVAKRICAISPALRQSEEIVGLNPLFAEWMMGLPLGWTDLGQSETQ
jgi:hypothetical protein